MNGGKCNATNIFSYKQKQHLGSKAKDDFENSRYKKTKQAKLSKKLTFLTS